MFTDKAEIELRAGKGGDGKLGYRHEKYKAKGGADGGDGGRGGSIIFEASHNQNTLSKYRTNRKVQADEGQPGGGNRKAGKSGADVIVPVPVGTVISESRVVSPESNVQSEKLKDESQKSNVNGQRSMVESEESNVKGQRSNVEASSVLADLTGDGQRVVVAKGGRGGFGNAHFISSVRQTPRMAEKGEPGERRKVILELKLVADVGLVGLPNAGKSTLLSVISNAKPEIADYPFTTLVPNLGVVDFEQNTFLVADIPGLIEGASEGKGLGDDFLRHIERTAVALHLVSVNSADIAADYKTIMNELKSYKVDLTDRPQLVVLTKIETVTAAQLRAQSQKLKSAMSKIGAGDNELFAISAVAHQGLDVLLRRASQLVLTARHAREAAAAAEPKAVISQADFPDLWHLTQDPDNAWRVTGGNIEGHARRSDWDNRDALDRLRDILHKIGVDKELTKRGAQPGDIIRIGNNEMEWL